MLNIITCKLFIYVNGCQAFGLGYSINYTIECFGDDEFLGQISCI